MTSTDFYSLSRFAYTDTGNVLLKNGQRLPHAAVPGIYILIMAAHEARGELEEDLPRWMEMTGAAKLLAGCVYIFIFITSYESLEYTFWPSISYLSRVFFLSLLHGTPFRTA